MGNKLFIHQESKEESYKITGRTHPNNEVFPLGGTPLKRGDLCLAFHPYRNRWMKAKIVHCIRGSAHNTVEFLKTEEIVSRSRYQIRNIKKHLKEEL